MENDVQSKILDLYAKGALSNYLEFDRASVMKYVSCTPALKLLLMFKISLRYFIPGDMNTQLKNVNPNTELSDYDKAFMVINYTRPQVDPHAPGWTLSHALDIMGVETYYKHSMMFARPEDVRKQFAVWAAGRVAGEPEGQRIEQQRALDLSTRDEPFVNWCASEDIPQGAEIPAEGGRKVEGAIGAARAVAIEQDYLWAPGSTITYWFQQEEYRLPQIADPYRRLRRRALLNAFLEWSDCSGLTFEEAEQDNGADIRIFFAETEGVYLKYSTNTNCWTSIGRHGQNRARKDKPAGGYPSTSMYLTLPPEHPGQGPDADDELWAKRRCLHETGHALGLRHEAGNPRTLQKVFEPSPNMLYLPVLWTEWDPLSIMSYPNEPLKANAPGYPARTPFTVDLSVLDKAFVAVSTFRIV